MAYDYERIPEFNPIRHDNTYEDFIKNFRREFEKMITAIKILKSEVKRLQDEKQDV